MKTAETRCYEREWYRNSTGEDAGHNHCGASYEKDGADWCIQGGGLGGYFGWCAARKPPKKGESHD